jgi:hypothetical protein
MPREGAIIFRDSVGRLDVLNVECAKCGLRDRYHLYRLIERYGIDAKLFDWSDEITADYPLVGYAFSHVSASESV